MVTALLDTNILIDHLGGYEPAREELGRYRERAISVVTWMEVLVGATIDTERHVRRFLARFTLVHLDLRIAEGAVALRRTYRLKLPDAIIWASARDRMAVLVTRNAKDFAADDPGVRHPYQR